MLLLRNMVGPGEVDAMLQQETAQECSKYGPVVKCLVFEVQGAAARRSPDLAVRIFVQFGKKDSAIKAHLDLNGEGLGWFGTWLVGLTAGAVGKERERTRERERERERERLSK